MINGKQSKTNVWEIRKKYSLCSSLIYIKLFFLLTSCCQEPDIVCQNVESISGETVDSLNNEIGENEQVSFDNPRIKTLFDFQSAMEDEPSISYLFVFPIKEAPEEAVDISFKRSWFTNNGSEASLTTNGITITP